MEAVHNAVVMGEVVPIMGGRRRRFKAFWYPSVQEILIGSWQTTV